MVMCSHYAEARVLRLCLAYPDNEDAVAATLNEFVGRCDGCTANVILTLATTLCGVLNDCQPGDWRGAMTSRLAELLDAMAESNGSSMKTQDRGRVTYSFPRVHPGGHAEVAGSRFPSPRCARPQNVAVPGRANYPATQSIPAWCGRS